MTLNGKSDIVEAERSVDPTAVRSCINCGAMGAGRYCAHCGQHEPQGRHTLQGMIGDALGRVLDLERGLVHTAWHLTVAPGGVVRDFLAGRTVPYTHPFGYLLIAFAAFALAQLLGSAAGEAGSHDRFFALLLVPWVAGVSRLLFWRTHLTFAEHLIAGMYLLGHVTLLLALLQTTAPLVGEDTLRALAYGGVGGGIAYVAWAYSRIFPQRPLVAAVGGLAALVGGVLLWGVSVAALIHWLR